jgi:hypothetical protein
MIKELRATGPRMDVQPAQGNTQHYKIVESVEEPGVGTTVTILAGEWLDMGTYTATLVDGDIRTKGSFAVYRCLSSLEAIKFVGTFTLSKDV